jgi:hypothetical protein
MGRYPLGGLGLLLALGVGAWMRTRSDGRTTTATPIAAPIAMQTTPPAGAAPSQTPTDRQSPPGPREDAPTEAALMDRLRIADPATVVALAREGTDRYPNGAGAEERDARTIDALVALDRIGEAHTDAMIFVQHHPSGPFSQHIMNLMGVHPRPPGAVPDPPLQANEGR